MKAELYNKAVARLEAPPTHFACLLSNHTLNSAPPGSLGSWSYLTPTDHTSGLLLEVNLCTQQWKVVYAGISCVFFFKRQEANISLFYDKCEIGLY